MRDGIHHSWRPGDYITATVNAAGIASGSIGPCPEGYVWYVERLTCFSTDTVLTTGGLLEIYSIPTEDSPNDESKSGRQDVAVDVIVLNSVSDQRSPIIVPPGYYLVAKWSGFNAGNTNTLSAQIEVRKIVLHDPRLKHGHHDMNWSGDDKHSDLRAVPTAPGDQVAQV